MNLRKTLPYLIVFVSFVAGIIILVIIFDSFIMPSIVHDRPITKVPAVINLTVEDATKILEEKKLLLHIVGEQYSENVPKGMIAQQTPDPEDEVKEGRQI